MAYYLPYAKLISSDIRETEVMGKEPRNGFVLIQRYSHGSLCATVCAEKIEIPHHNETGCNPMLQGGMVGEMKSCQCDSDLVHTKLSYKKRR